MHHSKRSISAITLLCLFLLFLPFSLLCARAEQTTIVATAPVYRQQALQFPPTPKKPVLDEYHGIRVIDDYRWLEDANDPAVRQWIDAQNQLSSSLLENDPRRAA